MLETLSHRAGICDNALQWFESYHTFHTQQVRINDSLPSLIALPHGVLQGSILRPMLFTLYLLALRDIFRYSCVNYHMYSDDTQIYLPVAQSNPPTSLQVLERFNIIEYLLGWVTAS